MMMQAVHENDEEMQGNLRRITDHEMNSVI